MLKVNKLKESLKDLIPDEGVRNTVYALHDLVKELQEAEHELDNCESDDFPFAGIRDAEERAMEYFQSLDERAKKLKEVYP